MKLVKNNPGYSITEVGNLFDRSGTELLIMPILAGVKQLSGEKIQNYLASELRDRITKTGVEIRIKDKLNRKELVVEPRKYTGRLLHDLPQPKSPLGEIYAELYLADPSGENQVSLFKRGTRVVPAVKELDPLNRPPWNSPYLEGLLDADFLQLTPGTRGGVIMDDSFDNFLHSLSELEAALINIIEEQKRAEEDHASKSILKRITKALREALRKLPEGDYDWLQIHPPRKTSVTAKDGDKAGQSEGQEDERVYAVEERQEQEVKQKAFFEYAGPLYSCAIRPGSVIMKCGETKQLRGVALDKSKRVIDAGVSFSWEIVSGEGRLEEEDTEINQFIAPEEPGIVQIKLTARQNDAVTEAEGMITVTKELIDESLTADGKDKKGLPGYTYQNAPGELWRSRYDMDRKIIYINNGHADFIFASRSNSRKLKYIFKLFSKELVAANFPELSPPQLMEKMIELQLYSEENL
jgi:hypothetical protein